MGEDVRYVEPNSGAVIARRKERGWSREKLADGAGLDCSTVKRAETHHRTTLKTMRAIRDAFNSEQVGSKVTLRDILLNFEGRPEVAEEGYTWRHLMTGAKVVAEKLYSKPKLHADAILTFPGPSSIFCGLVLAMLPLKVFMRLPVHTAIFRDVNLPSPDPPHFHKIRSNAFNLFIPEALTNNCPQRIFIIDDVILTGDTMALLRNFFANPKFEGNEITFACCICNDYHSLPSRKPPEIRGLPRWEPRLRFPMPWGYSSFCFEDAFVSTNATDGTAGTR